jgi:clan AA aspartic protease (TIGR02281 family)
VNEQIPKPQRLLTWWKASKIERKKMLKRLLSASVLALPIATNALAWTWEDRGCFRKAPTGAYTCPVPSALLPIPEQPQASPLPMVVPIPVEADGHFYPFVSVNGIKLEMIADTGASLVVLSDADMRKLGYDPQKLLYIDESTTPNGVMRTAPFILREMVIESAKLYNVEASCCTKGNTSLLGMSALSQFKITINKGFMLLEP